MDSPSDSPHLKPRDPVVRRLASLGVPERYLERLYKGMVDFVKENRSLLREVVSAILPTNEQVAVNIQEAKARSKKLSNVSLKSRFRESMLWLQWLMFEDDPVNALKNLSKMSVGQRGVCGAVWGLNDIAYRCRTCEHDPTCAICVPCFQNGNHKDHDYSIIYTGGGCCDCGDETAWRREGFCSRHKGAEKIQPLPENLANSVGPVLDVLFLCWSEMLFSAEAVFQDNPRASDPGSECRKIANELTFAVVELLLNFCACSESLLSFISKKVIATVRLLEILARAEKFLIEVVVRKLHELLLKLLGEPIFKYEFAKHFLCYYPIVIRDAIKEFSDNVLKKYPLLSTFSVQIFTVPTLTPRLVKEMNLLAMLFGCLGDIFVSCAGEDGHLQASKWGSLFETTNRVVGDVRFVMSHDAVSKYVTHDQQDISRTWLKLLTFVQGMNPIKRDIGLHIEEENESMHLLFVLSHSIANIHSLLVEGSFSADSAEETDVLSDVHEQDMYDLRHAKVGRLSQQSSVASLAGRSSALAVVSKADEINLDVMSNLLVPTAVRWLVFECLRMLENWLGVNDGASGTINYVFSQKPSSISSNRGNFLALKRTLCKTRKGRYIFGRLSDSSEGHIAGSVSQSYTGLQPCGNVEDGNNLSSDTRTSVADQLDAVASGSTGLDPTINMEEDVGMESDVLHLLSLSDWPDIIYDVSSEEVSVHIPLHRLLSLLLQKALRRCYGESAPVNVPISSSCSSLLAIKGDFFGHILGGCQPYGFSAFVMEHPLRIRAFCAQVNAGMWRKNGDVALVSSEWYRSVRWSEQGLELDLFLLQCCATLAPPDSYLSRILDRFGLNNYLSLSLERSSEFEPVLVQEMLTLIMQILQERRFCGLTTAESLKRELIYKLAIGDCTHSQLVKSLPRDLSKFDQLQEIINKVALFSNPSGFNQGMYSLRLQYWKELDLYHPRWNWRDLQVAQERYSRFCGVSALVTQLSSWTKIYHPLEGIAGVATCRVMLHIIRAVVFYAVFSDKTSESRAPDGILITALHLLSIALDICVQQKSSGLQNYPGDSLPLLSFAGEEISEAVLYGVGEQSLLSLLVILMRIHSKENLENFFEGGNCSFYPLIETLIKKFAEIDPQCMSKLRQLAPEVVDQLYQSLQNKDANLSGSLSDMEKRKAKARQRQAAILEKMKAEQSKFLSSISPDVDDDSGSGEAMSTSDVEEDTGNALQDVCSLCHDYNSKASVSFLILLQKSRLLSFIDKGPPAWDSPEKGNASVLSKTDRSGAGSSPSASGWTLSAVKRRSEDASNQRVNNEHGRRRDVKSFLEFVRSRFASVKSVSAPRMSSDVNESNTYTFETLEEDLYACICQEMCEKMLYANLEKDESVSTADGFQESSSDAESILLKKYVSGVSKNSSESISANANIRSDRVLESTSEVPCFDGFGPADCDGIYLSSCGHAVHQGCLDRYLSSLRERYVRRNIFEGAHIVDPDQGEFLCPVCRRLANSVLPAVPGSIQKASRELILSSDSRLGAFSLQTSDEASALRLRQALALLQSAANVVGGPHTLEAIPLHRKERTCRNLDLVTRVLSKMYFPKKQERFLASPRLNHSIIMWDTLRYSLVSTEIAARCGKTSMDPNYSLKSLYKEFRSSSEFISSLLLKVVQNTRKTNSLHVLQRFRGIQLFTQSICFGVPFGESEQGDRLLNALKCGEIEASYPDTQLWNRASDPVIARDPFSSLMWVVFCLPCPFLSCKESLFSLIHLFYAVSMVQALITYCGRHCFDVRESGHDSLVTDIYKMLGEFENVRQYFVTNYIEASMDIKDMIRRLSFPYLRRCSLLWKLLNSSVPAPFFDGDNAWDISSHVINDMMDTTEDVSTELAEGQALEKMFEIPCIDVLLQDGSLRSLAMKWLHHFHKENETQGFLSVLYCNPAVPFKLMNLPHVYQDLLQRYIKQSCPNCQSALDEPALCLLCGRLCSPSWKSCCRESGCLAHAMACGAGIGVFLLIRRTTILLQRCARQAPWPSPYLDAFGEEDIETHRGKPLYLNEERYATLAYMVASHGLDRSSKVLGQTTIGTFFLV